MYNFYYRTSAVQLMNYNFAYQNNAVICSDEAHPSTELGHINRLDNVNYKVDLGSIRTLINPQCCCPSLTDGELLTRGCQSTRHSQILCDELTVLLNRVVTS